MDCRRRVTLARRLGIFLSKKERFGFGNWGDISEHINTDKSKEEVERHYEDYYLSQKNLMPPPVSLSSRDKNTLILVQPRKSFDEKDKNKKKTPKNEKT